jgi:hypothetical protein
MYPVPTLDQDIEAITVIYTEAIVDGSLATAP